jgi:hypothetical protein
MAYLFIVYILFVRALACCTDEITPLGSSKATVHPVKPASRPVVVFAPVKKFFETEKVYSYIESFKEWLPRQDLELTSPLQDWPLTNVSNPWSFWPFLEELFAKSPLVSHLKVLDQLIEYFTPATLQEDSIYPRLFFNHLKSHKITLTSAHCKC